MQTALFVATLLLPLAPDSKLDELDPELAKALPRMESLMREAILQTSPNSSRWYTSAGGSLFTGSYDWHSSVIAHWSLLTMGRVQGDDDAVQYVLDRLDEDALEAEAAVLEKLDHDKRMTFPYDQAWLLMLLSELDQHLDPGHDQVAFDLREQTESRLLGWLEKNPFPENLKGRGGTRTPFCGYYRSWLWAYLLVRWSEPVTDGAIERLDALRDSRILPVREEVLELDAGHPFDFLWIPAIQALVERTDPAFEAPGEYPLQEFSTLPESVSLSNVHIVGVELSRLWPYAVDAARGVPGSASAYEARMKEVLARTDLWADSFTVVSHWVPQYLWIGIWLGLSRP